MNNFNMFWLIKYGLNKIVKVHKLKNLLARIEILILGDCHNKSKEKEIATRISLTLA